MTESPPKDEAARQARAQAEKWNVRYREAADRVPVPAAVLTENLHLLPQSGDALDLACGLGANALTLADKGLTTCAWDLSEVAVARLDAATRSRGLNIRAEVRDVLQSPPAAAAFDVIVVTHFLERALAPVLVEALRPGGLLLYQTFTRARVDDTGPGSAQFRLGENELLHLFSPLTLLVYREEGTVGDIGRGFRNEAILVGRKPDPGSN